MARKKAAEAQHTPGPWEQSADIIVKFGENWRVIAAMAEPRAHEQVKFAPLDMRSEFWDEQMANARLMTAAPELLSELEDLLTLYLDARRMLGDRIHGEPESEPAVLSARAVISKARLKAKSPSAAHEAPSEERE